MIIQGNALHLPLADKTVQCVVTSPPYWGLRDYGIDGQLGLEPTPEEYCADMVAVFREVKRVLRDDGTCWLNLGDSYYNYRGENNRRSDKDLTKRDTLQKDYHNIDSRPNEMRIDGMKGKDLCGIPWLVAFALRADGWYLRSDIIWSKPNPMPESVTDRPTKAHEYLFLLSKSQHYYYDAEAVKEPLADTTLPRMMRGVSDHHKNINGAPGQPPHSMNQPRQNVRGFVTKDNLPDMQHHGQNIPTGSMRNRRTVFEYGIEEYELFLAWLDEHQRDQKDVWTIATAPYSGAHFATYPPALVEPCIKAGSRPGDIIFDPFNGSGTTGMVAQQLGRRYVGIDLSFPYLRLAKERLGMKALEEWQNGIKTNNDGYHDLPLFGFADGGKA